MKKQKWFAVKTLYITRATGRSTAKAKAAFVELLEERVVLFQAANANAAAKAAEKDAKEYAEYEYQNMQGQTVSAEYLNACDVFEIYEDIDSGVEVFASTEVLTKKASKTDLINKKMGKIETAASLKLRERFLNKSLSEYFQK